MIQRYIYVLKYSKDWFWPQTFWKIYFRKYFSPIQRSEKNINKVLVLLSRIQKVFRFYCFVLLCNNICTQKISHNMSISSRLDVLGCWFWEKIGSTVTQVCPININIPFLFSCCFFYFMEVFFEIFQWIFFKQLINILQSFWVHQMISLVRIFH